MLPHINTFLNQDRSWFRVPIFLIGLGTKKSMNNEVNHQKKYNQVYVTGKLLSSDTRLCKHKDLGGCSALLTCTDNSCSLGFLISGETRFPSFKADQLGSQWVSIFKILSSKP